jgi:hypothetical protein
MKRNRHTLILSRIALLLLFLVAGPWAWNTLAELFNAPHAQFKHVIATLVLLLALRWAILPGRHGRNGRNRRQENGAI